MRCADDEKIQSIQCGCSGQSAHCLPSRPLQGLAPVLRQVGCLLLTHAVSPAMSHPVLEYVLLLCCVLLVLLFQLCQPRVPQSRGHPQLPRCTHREAPVNPLNVAHAVTGN